MDKTQISYEAVLIGKKKVAGTILVSSSLITPNYTPKDIVKDFIIKQHGDTPVDVVAS